MLDDSILHSVIVFSIDTYLRTIDLISHVSLFIF